MSVLARLCRWLPRLALALALLAIAIATEWMSAPAALYAEQSPVSAVASAPIIDRVEPTVGPVGTLLRISGRRLRGQTRVSLGEVPLLLELSTANLLTARVPAGVQTGLLRVSTSHGSVEGPEFNVSAPLPAPAITRFQPARAAAGEVITLFGEHFSLRLADNVVTFGAAPAIVDSASTSMLRVIVPEGAASGPIAVRVSNAGEARSALAFELARRLTLDRIVPPSAAPGSEVELFGSGFAARPNANRVRLGTRGLRVLAASPTRLLVSVPAGASSGALRVEVPGAESASLPLEILSAPVISGFAPIASSLPTRLRLSGHGFGPDPAALNVRLGSTPLRVLQVSPTQLDVQLPKSAETGKLTLELVGLGRAESNDEFVVTGALSVRELQPSSGPVGSEVAIVGQGFAPQPHQQKVFVGGVLAEVLAASTSRLELRVPPEAKSGPIAVQVGAHRAQSRNPFVVTAPPVIARISAETPAAGRELTLYGAGFGQQQALVHVALGGEPLPVLSVRDDTLVVRVPDTELTGELSVHVALQGRAVYPRPVRVLRAE